MNDYMVQIKGEVRDDDGLQIDMGEIKGTWFEVPLPACPDCGGDLVLYEAGHTPSNRKCMGRPIIPGAPGLSYYEDGGCGSMFSVQTANGRALLRRQRFF